MELKGNIRVFVRVRPPLPGEPSTLPFEFVDSGLGGADECQVIEVTEPQVGGWGMGGLGRRGRVCSGSEVRRSPFCAR